ncbi:hypothetical protein RHGRI_008488 [Rhododendron griersonianum]|uniref:Uncharacterized protein n=1 Tax=Rhododendron griersonianum TaxID=479676 RepID=A0AAV6L1P5_9ERIC|nr:hypothetical protein RHGRI_008488 [Rhododendron griersonianum]
MTPTVLETAPAAALEEITVDRVKSHSRLGFSASDSFSFPSGFSSGFGFGFCGSVWGWEWVGNLFIAHSYELRVYCI